MMLSLNHRLRRPALHLHQAAAGIGRRTNATVVCFRDDDECSSPALRELNGLTIELSPWGLRTLRGYGKFSSSSSSSSSTWKGFTTGGSNRGGDDDDDGKGRGRGDNNNEEKHSSSLPMVVALLTFSALHLGYCIAVWMKDGNLGIEFYGVGLGLVSLLSVSAVFVSIGAGSNAYSLGLWTSLAAMVWTGERCLVRKDGRLSGFVALFAAATAAMLCGALYHQGLSI